MNIVHIDWRIIYIGNGTPTIACIMKNEFQEIMAVGQSNEYLKNIKNHDIHYQLIKLNKSIEMLERDIHLLLQEPQDPLSFDKMLNQLPTSIYSTEGIMATSIAYHRWYAAENGLNLYELCAQNLNKKEISIPMPLFEIEKIKNNSTENAYTNFFIVPLSVNSYEESLNVAMYTLYEYKKINKKPETEAYTLEALSKVIDTIYDSYGYECALGVDWNANLKYNKEKDLYHIGNNWKTSEELILWYMQIINEYPILALHNLFDLNDNKSWQKWNLYMKKYNHSEIMQIGTNVINNIEECDALIFEATQCITVSQIIEQLLMHKKESKRIVLSCGPSCAYDPWIVDIGLSAGIDQIFFQQFPDVISKGTINRLLSIENDLM